MTNHLTWEPRWQPRHRDEHELIPLGGTVALQRSPRVSVDEHFKVSSNFVGGSRR